MKPKFKLQFVNAYTQNIIRTAYYETDEPIKEMISEIERTVNISEPSYIFDGNLRTYEAEYTNYSTITEDKVMIYKLFFKTKLAKKQFPVKHT